jgi:hypothetical protein
MILFFAGAEPKTFRDILVENGVKNILMSAYTLGYKKDVREIVREYDKVLMDSGGYTILSCLGVCNKG